MLSVPELCERRWLKDRDFLLVTNDCWGDRLSVVLNRPYATPFTAVYFYPDCYLNLLENLDSFLSSDLQYDYRSRYIEGPTSYPVGRFTSSPEEVEIHCYHYPQPEEARSKWLRRRDRFLDLRSKGIPLFVKFDIHSVDCGRYLQRFHRLPFANKVSFSRMPFEHPDHIHTPNVYRKRKDRPYNGLAYFRRRYKCFDFADWIIGCRPRKTWRSRLLGFMSF